MNELFVLTFHTTHDALAAAAALADTGIPHEKIPTPRVLSSECGFAIQAGPVAGSTLQQLHRNRALHWETCYRLTGARPPEYSRCIPEVS